MRDTIHATPSSGAVLLAVVREPRPGSAPRRAVLAARGARGATDQLRQVHGVRLVGKPEIEVTGEHVIVHVTMQDATGRTDSDVGAVPISGLKGEAYSNALMKAVTKAKRRCTLSLCGLGWLDESEIGSIPNARPAVQYTRELVEAGVIDAESVTVTGEPATAADDGWQRRMNALHALGAELGLTHDDLHQRAADVCCVRSMRELTGEQLVTLIQQLQAERPLRDERQPARADPETGELLADVPQPVRDDAAVFQQYITFRDELEGALSIAELNQTWKRVLAEVGNDPDLYASYQARMNELKR